MTFTIRPESHHDHDAITTLVALAFAGHPHSDGSEPGIIARLRQSGDLTLALVAEEHGQVIAHIAFSPVALEPFTEGWFGLGPVAVHPQHQSRGIGSALVTQGLRSLQALGARGCVVFGNEGFYSRFGFDRAHPLTYPHGPEHLFHALAMRGTKPAATVHYARAFDPA